MHMRIISPMAYGNGAYIVHKTLARRLPGYSVLGYSPRMEFFPFFMPFIMGRRKADIIHATPDYGSFFSRLNVPLVVTFHNFMLDRFMQAYSTLPQRIHYRTDLRYFTIKSLERADMVTSVSSFTADLVREVLGYRKEIRVIYNGIDQEKFKPAFKERKGQIKVLFAGNLTRRKGVDLLPKIVDQLSKNIIIQYTGGLRARDLAFSSNRLVGLGPIVYDKMPEIYQQADILLFPTVREGYGLVAAEAMASGLPVVATNCSSLPELVIDRKGGFLCELGNPTDFADKINLLASCENLRREMGEYNRERILEYFTLDCMVGNYQRLFEEIGG